MLGATSTSDPGQGYVKVQLELKESPTRTLEDEVQWQLASRRPERAGDWTDVCWYSPHHESKGFTDQEG